jgi:addiction module HigA family antidote
MTPNRVTIHPGEILAEDFLAPLDMSHNSLALALRVPATRIGAIINGKRAVSADTALRLARFFGTSAEFWMNLQAMHDLTKARMESRGLIESDVQPRGKRGVVSALRSKRGPAKFQREAASRAISHFAYDEEARELFVRYRGGTSYVYYAVSVDDYLALRDADSKGKFVNAVIKRKYEYRPVERA